jgi:hypothetical protein
MKYTIEIACTDGGRAGDVVHHIKVNEDNPRRARAKAQMLLGAWRDHGPKCASVFGRGNTKLYRLNWPRSVSTSD